MGGPSIELAEPNNPFGLYLIKNIIIPRKGKGEKTYRANKQLYRFIVFKGSYKIMEHGCF
jgi:hypothetical protein